MASTLVLSVLLGLLAFPNLALAGCYYDVYDNYVCDDFNWVAYYALRVGIGLAVAVVLGISIFFIVLRRRRNLRAVNAAYLPRSTPAGNVPPPAYGPGYYQSNNQYSTPYSGNADSGYQYGGYSYAAYPPKTYDKQGQYAAIPPTGP